jgi:hypothetical protein
MEKLDTYTVYALENMVTLDAQFLRGGGGGKETIPSNVYQISVC